MSVWVHHALNKKTYEDRIFTTTSFLSRPRNEPLLKYIVTSENASFMIIFKTKRESMTLSRLPLSCTSWKESYAVCMARSPWYYSFWVFKPQSVTSDIFTQKLQHGHENPWGKRLALLIWYTLCFLLITQGPHSTRITLEKYWIKASVLYRTHHIYQTLHQGISIF